MATEHLSFCRICAAACGIVVTVEGQTVVRVRGDAGHPVSRGYVCAKARGLPAWHHASARLDHPRLGGRIAAWDDVLDDLSARLRDTSADHGADAVGLYLATGLAYDSAGQIAAGMWMRSIASTSFYSAATVDNSPVLVAAELVAGNAMLNPVWDPGRPGLLVLIGTNPVVSHGYGTTLPDPVRRLRDFRSGGGRVWVVDPRRTESAQLADQYLSIRPGGDVALLAAVARELLLETDEVDHVLAADLVALRMALAPWTVERAAVESGVDTDAINRLVADVRSSHGCLAVFCGTGTTMGRDGVIVEWLRWVLLILAGSLDVQTGMRFNRGVVNRLRSPRSVGSARDDGPRSRPELRRIAGQMPAVAMVDEIEAGHLRALIVTGGNPLTAFPEPDRVRAALASLDVLVVIDIADNELCSLATHVLPATGQLERADLSLAEHVSIRSGMQATHAVVDAVAERRPVWWMLDDLAHRIGNAHSPSATTRTDEQQLAALLPHVSVADLFEAGPRGHDTSPEFGWVLETMLPGGHWTIAPSQLIERLAERADSPGHDIESLTLVPRREMAWSNSVHFGHDGDGDGHTAEARLHSTDVDAAGVVDGGRIEISSAHGTVTARVAIDDNVRPGVVSMTHGRSARNPGALTSATADVDTLTAMPLASGLPVSIRPV